MRITVTKQHLEESVQVLNERIPGVGFSVGYAYGEARLERRNGSVDVTGTKREILSYIIAMIAGFEECERRASHSTSHKAMTLSPKFSFTADNGTPFVVRMVRHGDKYGLDMCLTHTPHPEYDFDSPLIEFYDARYDFDKDTDGTPMGQFVSRYYLSTLTDTRTQVRRNENNEPNRGVQLHGDVAAWSVDPQSLATVIQWAIGCTD
mgnify:CR=1 FL=1|jgi:hypothetical protein